MAEDLWPDSDWLFVGAVSPATIVHNSLHGDEGNFKRRPNPRRQYRKTPAGYMHALSKAAEKSNLELKKKGLPFRFCICEENGEMVIDLVEIGPSGVIVAETKRRIDNEEFGRTIEDVSMIEGLYIDRNG